MFTTETIKPRAVFDFHIHLMGEKRIDAEFLAFARDWNMPFAVSCLGPEGHMIANPTINECRRCNDLVIDLMEKHPDLAYGFCYVSQEHEHLAVEEVRRCVRNGMVGIKLWVAAKCSDERTFPIAEEAIISNVPILQHSYLRWKEILPGESKPVDIVQLAKRYPKLNMIMAHMAFRWKEGVDTVKECPNIYVDTSGFDPELGSVEYAVENLGVDHVLYGSDAPGRDPVCQLGRVMAADISAGDREKILHINAKKLLGLAGGAA